MAHLVLFPLEGDAATLVRPTKTALLYSQSVGGRSRAWAGTALTNALLIEM
jgi:hypothetical protein